ncbi:MAG: nucleotidyl transferase AbiEii/AbiGii toxin family protein [Phycisphaeraceae bacterium]|nr:nucleotidyl transferase AbiEii/AbiGii toxin family protein [Phycisphaeraceae bacterium]
MISRIHIDERVREWGLREDVIEKDYVLGWLLWGIGTEPELAEQWAFKGGTCLKKCYLETYRFSEDLDFTIVPGGPINAEDVEPVLLRMLDRVGQESGINFAQQAPRLRTAAPGRYTEGRIYYIGPRQSPTVARVKLDLSGSEVIARPTAVRPISHPYPDDLPDPGAVRCYAFEEVFAEKIRAMGERGRPRDLYDIVNLYRREDLHGQRDLIVTVLREKCHTKGIPVPTFRAIEQAQARAELEAEWQNMLGHQLPVTPPFEAFWSELAALFEWLEGVREPVVQDRISVASAGAEDASWTPPRTVTTWGGAAPMESVRFAAANRLCVELRYNGTTRLIEPYSLRRSQAGNLLLYAIRTDSREPRAYRVDRIQGVRVMDRVFTPVYRVEIGAAGPLSAPPVTDVRQSVHRARPSSSEPVYIIQCPSCGKQFRRKTRDMTLRSHKTPDGYQCHGGGRGSLVDTRYG